MRSLPVALIATLGAMALAQPAFASHGCPTRFARGVDVVTQTRESIVFEKRDRLYACAFSVGNTYRLPKVDPIGTEPGDVASNIELSGRFVAYESAFVEPAGAETHSDIIVLSLITGERVTDESASPNPPIGEDNDIASIVVKRNGSVALTVFRANTVQVRRISQEPEAPGNVLLDSSPSIDARSLAMSADRRRIFWQNGATAKTALLP